MIIRVRAQKVDEKNGIICLVSFFYSWFMVLKLLKIVHFLKMWADLSKKPKSIKVINLYPSENITFYRGMSNSSGNIEE